MIDSVTHSCRLSLLLFLNEIFISIRQTGFWLKPANTVKWSWPILTSCLLYCYKSNITVTIVLKAHSKSHADIQNQSPLSRVILLDCKKRADTINVKVLLACLLEKKRKKSSEHLCTVLKILRSFEESLKTCDKEKSHLLCRLHSTDSENHVIIHIHEFEAIIQSPCCNMTKRKSGASTHD